MSSLLDGARLLRSDIGGWAVHPGGRRILDVAQEHLGLEEREVAPSFEVLRRHGNLSSATLGFVLEQALSCGGEGAVVALGFGPGLTLEGAVFAGVR